MFANKHLCTLIHTQEQNLTPQYEAIYPGRKLPARVSYVVRNRPLDRVAKSHREVIGELSVRTSKFLLARQTQRAANLHFCALKVREKFRRQLGIILPKKKVLTYNRGFELHQKVWTTPQIVDNNLHT
jgi:hypothetical protein